MLHEVERDFRETVSSKIQLVAEGLDRYRVLNPFLFDDGDHLSVVLRREGGAWVLSDEGNTWMRLTYDFKERDLLSGNRQKVISDALSVFRIEDREREFVIPVPEDRYGDALFSFVQGILKVASVSLLSREYVSSTFMEDFRSLMRDAVPKDRLEFEWHDRERDPKELYPVDCRINGAAAPLFVQALASDDTTRDATTTLLKFETWGVQFRSVGIFRDQEVIGRKVLARYSDIGEKQYSSLTGNRVRIKDYLGQWIAA